MGLVISNERVVGLSGARANYVLLIIEEELRFCLLHDETTDSTWCRL